MGKRPFNNYSVPDLLYVQEISLTQFLRQSKKKAHLNRGETEYQEKKRDRKLYRVANTIEYNAEGAY